MHLQVAQIREYVMLICFIFYLWTLCPIFPGTNLRSPMRCFFFHKDVFVFQQEECHMLQVFVRCFSTGFLLKQKNLQFVRQQKNQLAKPLRNSKSKMINLWGAVPPISCSWWSQAKNINVGNLSFSTAEYFFSEKSMHWKNNMNVKKKGSWQVLIWGEEKWCQHKRDTSVSNGGIALCPLDSGKMFCGHSLVHHSSFQKNTMQLKHEDVFRTWNSWLVLGAEVFFSGFFFLQSDTLLLGG